MGLFDSFMSTVEKRNDQTRQKVNARYNAVSYSARDKSDAELRSAYKSSNDSVERAALANEARRRKNS